LFRKTAATLPYGQGIPSAAVLLVGEIPRTPLLVGSFPHPLKLPRIPGAKGSDNYMAKFYTHREHDTHDPADSIKIERSIYANANPNITQLAALPLTRLQEMREESAAAERVVFESLQEAAGAWNEQAAVTLVFDNAIEYAKMPPVKHTANEWGKSQYGRDEISNMVYKMDYHVYEHTRYDRNAEKSVPAAWDVTWSVRTNAPGHYHDGIAGQTNKRYTDKSEAEKYLAGRIKAYSHLFTEISPPIPTVYADTFRVNGHLLPGYTLEHEEFYPPERAAEISGVSVIDEKINELLRKERENMNEPLNIKLSTREMYEAGGGDGAWLKLPATTEQLNATLARIGVQDNDFIISGVETPIPSIERIPLENVQQAGLDELNYLAARLETIEPVQLAKLNAAIEVMSDSDNIHRLIEYTHNTDFFVHNSGVYNNIQLGEQCLDSGLIEMPEEWLVAINVEMLGEIAATNEKGVFTEHGYIYHSGDEWKPVNEIPQEYKIAVQIEYDITRTPDVADTTPTEQTKAAAVTTTPFVLVSDNPRDKLTEITGKLEAGIKGVFESEQYKTYLNTFSKFHNYSLNNCLLIAMQKPDASHVGGFNFWRDEMKRPVMKGEKGIKIIAPSPFKAKKLVDAVDAGGKPVFKDGKRVKEEQEITVPAFKVTTVFDVSQTDGEPLPQLGVSELTGSVDKYKEFFAAIEKSSPVPISIEPITGGAKGYYHQTEKRIAINEGMSELQNLKTAIHEMAHSRLHAIDTEKPLKGQNIPDRHTREVEAESIAYTVCQHYGLDTSDYSFAYVATWSGDKELDTLKSSLETIRKEAAAIITEVDKHFAELTQDKEQAIEQTAPTPELQTALQGLQGEVKETLQFFMDEDIKNHGELRPGTLEMIAVQGFELRDGELVEAPPVNGTFTIYQLKDGNETRDIRFEPFDSLKEAPDMANYNHIYTAPLKHGDSPASIHLAFNLDEKPEGFGGHSVSISDVIVMNKDGQETAYYVDKAGFKELPDFIAPKEQAQGREAEPQGTPFYQAYKSLSNEYPDNIVFTKVGDFYEVMGDKAVTVANEPGLGFTVAGRDVGLPERVPLVGIPAHNFDAVLKELNNRNHTVIVADNVVVRRYEPAPPLNMKVVADYLQKQNNYAQGADPNSQTAETTVNIVTRRLEQANERIPDQHPQLKALLSHAAQSPDLPTLKERMNTLHSEFIQHYSTAVQNTVDMSGKAEPKLAPNQHIENHGGVDFVYTTAAPKTPAQGENVAAVEAKVKAGEAINLTDLSDAIKKDKQAAQTTGKTATTKGKGKTATKAEQPSIKEKIAAGKQQLAGQKSAPTKTATKNKNTGLGD